MTRHLVSTAAAEITCGTCGAPILRALDEGLPTRINPAPIPPTEEITALLAGRRTYTLTTGREIVYRDATRIRGRLTGTIHTEHQCAQKEAHI